MKVKMSCLLTAAAALFAARHGIAPVHAQSGGGPYRIDAVAITGGGALGGGTFQLRGTFGQALIGPTTAPAYALNAGFVVADDSVFRSGFEYQ